MYQVLSADKLKLYPTGSTYKDASGAIFLNEGVKPIAGTFKTVGAPGGSLDQTLPSEKSLPTSPSGSVDNLTAMKLVMQQMGDLAKKQGLAGGTQALLGGLEKQGMGPSNIPGSLVGNIVNFVETQSGNPIQRQLDTMNTIIEAVGQQKKEAQNQIDSMISNGLWGQISGDQRQSIWNAAGYTGKPTVLGKTSFEHFTDADGHVWNIQYDMATGDIISKTDFGPVGKGFKPTTNGPGSDKDAVATKKDFGADLANPKSVGIDKQIAIHGEEKTRPDLYVSRETLIQKLNAAYSWAYPLEDIKRAVYEAYPG